MDKQNDDRNPEQPPIPAPKKKPEMPAARFSPKGMLMWFILFALMLMAYQYYLRDQETTQPLIYNPDFVQLVERKEVTECEIVEEISGNQFITGTLKTLDARTGKPKRFKVDVMVTDAMPKWLRDNGVKFGFKRQSPYFWQVVSGALPVLLLLGLLYYMFNRQMKAAGHGALSFGKSRAKMMARDKNKVTFKDVAGVEEAKEEVQEIIDFLKDPKRFQKLGGHIPKGVLLMGPPGTGKTLLAKAIAGEADVPFFSISGSDFVEMFVGVGASRVRDMFEQGKRNAPCIIFIDEIDAVGRSRFSGIGGGHDEREQTLNALLVEMDGFDTQEGVIIIAATNRPDVLDPALQRPGRFDRQIVIDLPTLEGRIEILKIHARSIKLDAMADLRRLARGTPGFSGADLANLINEAALLAARNNKEGVAQSDLEEARDKVRWGRERRSRVLDEKEKKITAYHETGHALIGLMVEESEPLHKITIIPRGTAYLGATMQLPVKDRYMEGRTKLLGILTTMMGGRVAEEMVFGDITSGASSDLKQATRLARLMVCDWGMSPELGPQTFGSHEDLMFLGRDITRSQDFSDDTARRIDAEVSRLLRESYQRAKDILEKNRGSLDIVAKTLIERETLDGRDVDALVKHGRLLTDEERAAAESKDKEGATDGAGTVLTEAVPAPAPVVTVGDA
jgi:cell division protease FtsH